MRAQAWSRRIVKTTGLILVAGLLALFLISYAASRYHDVSMRFLYGKALENIGLESPFLLELTRPRPRYLEHDLDGRIYQQHPRILLPELRGWQGGVPAPGMPERLSLLQNSGSPLRGTPSCGSRHVMSQVICWLSTGRDEDARLAAELLVEKLPPIPEKSLNTDIWEAALAYDFLADSPQFPSHQKERVGGQLRRHLELHLEQLDGDGPSLWHGRSSLAANAWLLAIALYDGSEDIDTLARRAQGHFQQSINALALTEAWPEGYNYWINSRALLMSLAISAYVNGLEDSQLAAIARQALLRAGLWTVYTTRPDNRVEALADEGPRVDLKDETRRVIDVMAQLTRSPVLATYSAYLEQLHRGESYYRGYRWSYPLFHDPSVPLLPGMEKGRLAGLHNYLPDTDIFGRGALNLWVSRSGWDDQDTFITMRAGHTFTHHGHYDAGHFTLFKGAPLVIDSSRYNGMFRPHRLYYGVRTIAKNSLLVVRPGDTVKPNKLFEKNVNEGGQRLVIPTGSRIRDLEHWGRQLGDGNHYEGGELLDYQFSRGRYAYVRADLTAAYDSVRYDSQGKGGKISHAVRELVYFIDEDILLVHDDVASTDANFRKKWLLHTVERPEFESSQLLLGGERAGIFISDSDSALVRNGIGRLDVKKFLPEGSVMRSVGGEGFQFFVESDGSEKDDTAFRSGENFNSGGEQQRWFDNGLWRLEVEPTDPRERHHFLVSLAPSIETDRSHAIAAVPASGDLVAALATDERAVVFVDPGKPRSLSLEVSGRQRLLTLIGVARGDTYTISRGSWIERVQADRSGVLEVPLEPGKETIITVQGV